MDHEFLLKDRDTLAEDLLACVLLLDPVDHRVQSTGKTFFHGEHLQFAPGRQPIVSGQVLVPCDVIAEEREGAIESLVMPLRRVDEHPIQVEKDCLDLLLHHAVGASPSYLSPRTQGIFTTTVVVSGNA